MLRYIKCQIMELEVIQMVNFGMAVLLGFLDFYIRKMLGWEVVALPNSPRVEIRHATNISIYTTNSSLDKEGLEHPTLPTEERKTEWLQCVPIIQDNVGHFILI